MSLQYLAFTLLPTIAVGVLGTRRRPAWLSRPVSGDDLGEAILDGLHRLAERDRRWWAALHEVLRAWAAAFVDPALPGFGALDLAAAASSGAPVHPLVGLVQAHVVDPVVRLVDVAERGFAERWPVEGQARQAGRLLVASLALLCAGLVGTATAVAPPAMARIDTHPLAAIPSTLEEAGVATSPEGSGGSDGSGDRPAAPAPGEPLGAAGRAGDADGAVSRDGPRLASAPVPPVRRGALPTGKGMYLWQPERVEGADPHAIVARAKAVGLTHVYVRTGSSKMGFYAQDFLNALLPVAHDAGIRVYGWDFPYFYSWQEDVQRAAAAIRYTTPDGHRIDGFAADIETTSEGTRVAADDMRLYGEHLRANVGADYPLIAVIPRPSERLITGGYPFAQIVGSFDAISPMVYWMNRDPGTDVAGAMQFLSQFGKPVHPIGQAYDGGPEGGPRGVPPREQLIRFMHVAEQHGAASVSFWSWQHADQQAWDAIRDAAEFQLFTGPAGGGLAAGKVQGYQHLLTSLGFPVPPTGVWDPVTVDAVRAYQREAGLPVTGDIDDATLRLLLRPFASPLKP